jgi:uncharacterized protein DUF3309
VSWQAQEEETNEWTKSISVVCSNRILNRRACASILSPSHATQHWLVVPWVFVFVVRIFSDTTLTDDGMGTILIIILILLLIGAVPRWGYSSNWGYGPSGVLGLILVVVIILLLLGHL